MMQETSEASVEAPESVPEPRLGLACAAVADAVFYHASDVSHRTKLALALVDLAQEIQRTIELGRQL